MIEHKPANPEKEAKSNVAPAERVAKLADHMEKLHGTKISEERRKWAESQIDRLEDICWLLGKTPL